MLRTIQGNRLSEYTLEYATMLKLLLSCLLCSVWSTTASAKTTIFDCNFPSEKLSFVVTVYDDGTVARIGREQGAGDKAQAYFDSITGAWIVVEFIADGTLPSTLTTILKDGRTWHSRHTMDVGGGIVPSQMSGKCLRRSI